MYCEIQCTLTEDVFPSAKNTLIISNNNATLSKSMVGVPLYVHLLIPNTHIHICLIDLFIILSPCKSTSEK